MLNSLLIDAELCSINCTHVTDSRGAVPESSRTRGEQEPATDSEYELTVNDYLEKHNAAVA
jgi:hypothetical protein